jgi:hypothetical protein
MSSRPSINASPDQWMQIAYWLAEWDNIFDVHTNLGLVDTHKEFRRECNSEFSRFILANYQRWINSKRSDRPTLSVDIANEKIIPHLTTGQFFSILPSATPYCRNALFSGMFPSDLAERYPDLWIDPADDPASRNRYEHQLLDKLIAQNNVKLPGDSKYIKVLDPEEGESLVHRLKSYLSAPLTSIVVNFLDILAHSRAANEALKEISSDESAYRSVMKTWFAHSSLYKALLALSTEDVVIVITTDHGSTIGKRGTKAFGKKDTSTNLRYKFGENINCEEKGGFLIRNPKEWRLPTFSRTTNYILALEDYYFVYATNFSQYDRQYRNSFVHGGISIEEMIVPVATLLPK